MRIFQILALIAGAATSSVACAPRVPAALGQTPGEVTAQPGPSLTESELGDAVARLLEQPALYPDRHALLVQVFALQMQRAARYLKGGHEEEGLAAMRGAFLLAQPSDFQDDLFTSLSFEPLALGATTFAQNGSEGPAEALYGVLAKSLPTGADRTEAEQHLAALRRWQRDTRTPGTLEAHGLAHRAAQGKAMLMPTPQNLEDARKATLGWMLKADELRDEQSPPRDFAEKDEYDAAFRASGIAPWVLTALYLRVGSASQALDALQDQELDRRTPPGLKELLRLAAERDDPRAWAELSQQMRAVEVSDNNPVGLEPELVAGASFGAALELWRAQPAEFGAAAPLCTLLLGHGLAEAIPAVLQPGLAKTEDPRAASFALTLLMQGLLRADSTGDIGQARVLFDNAASILGHARRVLRDGTSPPYPADVAYAMGEIESRAGDLSRARPHLQSAAAERPSVAAFNLLAAIARQRGESQEALAALDQVVSLAEREQRPLAVAEALLARFEVLRDQGSNAEAEKSLGQALDSTLRARGAARQTPELARAERLLTRLLGLFNLPDAARRASRRAFDLSRNDRQQLTATVLDTARCALTTGDLQLGRQAVREALRGNLADEDTLYATLWLKLLEQRKSVGSDGTAAEALASIEQEQGWIARLAAWSRGRLSDESLLRSASTTAEKVEADFYTAMQIRDPAALKPRLQGVARSEAIQLIEVSIARELLLGEPAGRPRLPPGLVLP